MKIIFVCIGTRGDMEPMIAIGEIMKDGGHQVICAFPEQFRELAGASGLEYVSLGPAYVEMLETEAAKAAMGGGGSGVSKLIANIKLANDQTAVNKDLIHKQHEILTKENPDRVVYNGKAVYPLIWGISKPGKGILICPLPYMHKVKNHAHVAFNGDYGPALNRMTYALADFGQYMTVRLSARWLNIAGVTLRKFSDVRLSHSAIYTISPTLFPQPVDWPVNLRVYGYQAPRRAEEWQPDQAILDFLEDHQNERMLLITFGSMNNPHPESKTKIFVDILKRNKIPAIINIAAGGLARPADVDYEGVLFVRQIPYDWIFPRIYGVIHHGGAGTTHLALRYGCASMVVPHIIDQFVWDKIVADLGAGPEGIKIGKISTENLEPKILALVKTDAYKKVAEQISQQMQKEDFRDEIYHTIIGD